MVDGLQRYLRSVHGTARAVGVEELCRLPGMPDARTVYRWHGSLGDDLIYFPNIALHALGFVHLHVFSDEPVACDYAVSALWVVRSPGHRLVYLHCVVPDDVAEPLRAKFRQSPGVTIITTSDGWQVLGGPDTHPPRCTPDSRDIIERYPLLIPAIFESIESRQSYPGLWDAIYGRLGGRVWEYLPRFSRRLPHNGKQYVREAFRLLNDAHLVGQHLVRFGPWREVGIELFLLIAAPAEEVVSALSQAVAVEVYPTDTGSLVHLFAPLSCLTLLFSASLALPITSVWFVDRTTNERQPLRARVAYERLFDPQTGSWVLA